jgi:aspartyl-tRNA synthetase
MKDVDFKVFSGRPMRRTAVSRPARAGAASCRAAKSTPTPVRRIYGAKGLAWIKVNEKAKGRDGLQSPIVKNLHDARSPRSSSAPAPRTATSSSSAPTRPRSSTTPSARCA